ncbi:MAG: M1 family peptidase [Planctomycetota bacterium]|nr:MAG: M1 family peptidase [Planctomycetota bacterium]
MKHFLLLAPLLIGAACRSAPQSNAPSTRMDPHSYAEPDRVRVTHLDLELTLDFESQTAAGQAALALDRRDPDAPVILDTLGLVIESVTGQDGGARTFELGPGDEGFGQPLTVELEPGDSVIRIRYRTTANSAALQWLAPEQTAGKEHPFLFTQGQAILTRSWIPLQDSPGVRISYAARIHAPEALTVVMSAEQLGRDGDGAFRFVLQQPIPPYLIALACGDIETRAISERCAVWAEPSVTGSAHSEFADTEAMIQSAEKLFGPYRWGRYDLIILPPAFPYGGMENPLLTFVTPTVLAGDRSLVSLVAHELAHSWSGNLVTNATWRDFWLNEGFTVYFEQRIMEEVYGKDRSDLEKLLAFEGLEREIAAAEPWATVLHLDLAGRHPDEGFSGIPYEKGALFLRRLEEIFGRETFDEFLRSWFDEHAFQSVTTATFEEFLAERLLARAPELAAKIDVHEWIHEPGLPADAPRPTSGAIAAVDAEVARWQAGTSPAELATSSWVTQQWLHFLEHLPEDMSAERMAALDTEFAFTESSNSEILCVWLELGIRHGYTASDARLERFLMTVGRRKFLQPLYKELVQTEAGTARARAIYARARPRYHAVSTGTLDGIVLGK